MDNFCAPNSDRYFTVPKDTPFYFIEHNDTHQWLTQDSVNYALFENNEFAYTKKPLEAAFRDSEYSYILWDKEAATVFCIYNKLQDTHKVTEHLFIEDRRFTVDGGLNKIN